MGELSARRLPGIRFEVQPAAVRDVLPRMDIAVFVGFAAAGPLHRPVVIEDPAQFADAFGADAALAWDPSRGGFVTALLGPSVRDFFANGGRRCWVIRVAGPEARPNCFALPGLAVARFDAAGGPPVLEPAYARARAAGSWSDTLECATALRRTAVAAVGVGDGGATVDVRATRFDTLGRGDLLRVSLETGVVLYAAIDRIEALSASPPDDAVLRAHCAQPVWIERLAGAAVANGGSAAIATWTDGVVAPPPADGEPPPSECRWARRESPAQVADGAAADEIVVTLEGESGRGLAPGMALQLETADSPSQTWWFVADRVGVAAGVSATLGRAELVGQAFRAVAAPPMASIASAELLTFDLRARRGAQWSQTLRALGFAPAHSRYWNAAPDDDAFYAVADAAADAPEADLGRDESGGRFPLAGGAAAEALLLPLGMDGALERFLPSCPIDGDRLSRDGLAELTPELFLDAALADVSPEALSDTADFIRYGSPRPRALRGIHAALGWREATVADEATLIAVPDAVQRSWHTVRGADQPWWRPLPAVAPAEPTPAGVFVPCAAEHLEPPVFYEGEAPDLDGTFVLRWTSDVDAATFVLEEATHLSFADAVAVYAARVPQCTLYDREPGDYYYRVRAEHGAARSQWSVPIWVHLAAGDAVVDDPQQYRAETLIDVQRALLRLCAMRGDLLAVLALPEHYREGDAIAHARVLRGLATAPAADPLPEGDRTALSYAALYHPWLATRTGTGVLVSGPPDGAACGVLASRALTRDAWIAPANEPLRATLALLPPLSAEAWSGLQDAQVNVVRQEPRGFLWLSADTLAREVELRPVNVRRLLSLLRRMALRHGATYVFEPYDATFRRTVQRTFDALLYDLFERGAFAGATPSSAYQVATDDTLNTPSSVERGRMIVELRIAPSLPMSFLTVRLVQTGDRFIAQESR